MTSVPPCPRARTLALAPTLLFLLAGSALSQTAAPPPPNPARGTRAERSDRREQSPVTSFHLKYLTQGNDANELLTALRLLLDPGVKLYLDTRDNTILMRGLPEEVAEATTLVTELDHPRGTFRLTFTIAELDGTRTLSSHTYAMTVLDGQRTTLRRGMRVPVMTSKLEGSGPNVEQQMSYLDVGISLDATVNSNQTGAILKQKVELSSLPDTIPPGTTDPNIHQTVMEGTTSLQLGRPTPLGTLDSEGPARHTEVTVKLDKLP